MLTHVHRTIIVATISALPLHPVLSIVPLFHGYSLKFSEHNRATRRSFLQHSLPSVFFYIRNYCTTHASNLTLRIYPPFYSFYLFFTKVFLTEELWYFPWVFNASRKITYKLKKLILLFWKRSENL